MKSWATILILGLTLNLHASTLLTKKDIEFELKQFFHGPNAFEKRVPLRKGAKHTVFSAQTPVSEVYKLKHHWREEQLKKNKQKAEYAKEERPIEAFVEANKIIKSLQDIPQELMQGQVDNLPWSDDYWPIYAGILGNRYSDVEFAANNTWDQYHQYVLQNPALAIFESQDPALIDRLSPAEKYDLLFGTDQFYLTRSGWKQGQQYFDAYGEVERWMGICHGWAPASYMMKRPLKKVVVKAFDGKTDITFYPADIKALMSLLWAQTEFETRFIGRRCKDKDVKLDPEGKILVPECFDINPSLWHMAVINQLGVLKRSFVLDATFDYEVWNQPIVSYEYSYFNPQTQAASEKLEGALIPYSEFTSDPYKSYRSNKTKKIVGVAMQVTYSVEATPRQYEEESDELNRYTTVMYMYDLEIDDKGKMIGGEWYNTLHPDFLWTPSFEAKPVTKGDYGLLGQGLWNGKSALDENYLLNGMISASRGQPLMKLVESLLELSRK
jgi:hypothetical protein